MIFKCKICGGELNIQKGQSIVECEYCGVKQTLPRFLDENIKLMYDRANSYLLHNEFDKAENIYNQILLADREDAEAYWSLVLCKYGVTYVKDPASGKYIPTCNRTHYASVFNDENYRNAIQYANAEKAELYEQDAKTIDDIQRGILSISKHEKPFDIFISYKETGENGARTKDSIKAQELYDKLTAEGYKVFFSRITLEDKIGTEYEPYIYAALASSKIMLVIGSSKENLEAVWVKNEWSRYLSFAQRDSEKTLIPLYFDMDKADLPEEFVHLTAYDMAVDGFEQELIRGIKKLIPLPVMLAERRKKFRRKLKIAGVAVLALAIIGGIASVPWFMKLPDYNAAMQLYYDKNYPEAAWAFADLGSYRDSEEMKDTCERSWRNSLANTFSNRIGAITPNGETQILDSYFEQNTFEINEHGRIISLDGGVVNNLLDYTDAYKTYRYIDVIYEDGYIDHAYVATEAFSYEDQPYDISKGKKAYDTSQWHNIIQIVPFTGVTVALRSDGKVLFQNNAGKLATDSEWLKEAASWENVIQLLYVSLSDRYPSLLIGLRSDGTLCCITDTTAQNSDYDASEFWEAVEILKEMKNIKTVDVAHDTTYNKKGYVSALTLNIAALTQDKKLITYVDGIHNEAEARDVIDIQFINNRIFILDSNGELSEINHDKVYLKDVIKIYYSGFESTAVTRSGTVYQFEQESFKQNNRVSKVEVYDEWIERMN